MSLVDKKYCIFHCVRDIYGVLHLLDQDFIEKKDNRWEHCVKGVLRRKLIVECTTLWTYFFYHIVFVHDRYGSETLGIGSEKRRG